MPNITVRHCKLRVRRRGGWRWGATRNQLVDSAVAALRDLLQRRLTTLTIESDRDVREPVRITVPLSLRDFLETASATQAAGTAQSWQRRVEQRVEQALRPHLASPSTVRLAASPTLAATAPTDAPDSSPAPRSSAGKLLSWLVRLRARGELGLYLRALSHATLVAWDRILFLGNTFSPPAQLSAALARQSAPAGRAPRPASTPHQHPVDSDPATKPASELHPIQNKTQAALPYTDALRSSSTTVPGTADMAIVVHDTLATVERANDPTTYLRNRLICAVELAYRLHRAPDDPRVRECIDAALAAAPHAALPATADPPPGPPRRAPARSAGPSSPPYQQQTPAATDQPPADYGAAPHPAPAAASHALSTSAPAARPNQRHTPAPHSPALPAPKPRLGRRADGGSKFHAPAQPPLHHSLRDATTAALSTPMPPGQRTLHSALPFLLLGPLARIGYFEALEASFEALAGPPHLGVFAAALAYKVLEPLQRGWRRDPRSDADAAAFAGLEHPVPAAQITQLAHAAHVLVSPLNALLARNLLTHRNTEAPLLLERVPVPDGHALLLVDVTEAVPVACAPQLAGLADTLQLCDTALFLIDRNTARNDILAELNRRGLRFVTDAPPTRNERWRTLRRRHQRWWTNDTAGTESKLIRHAMRLTDASETVGAWWHALGVQRRAAPLADDPTFDDALTLAAAVALGRIARTLWHDREPTDPRLTLTRLGDLSARLHVDEQTVRLVLPLGRRSSDLAHAGLLQDVPAVPWFPRRTVTFARG